MAKKWLTVWMALLLAFSVPAIGSAAATGNAKIAATVSFRADPSTNGTLLRYLKAGEQVTVTSEVNAYWYAVTDSTGKTGYVSSQDKYIKLTGAIPAPPAPVTGNAKIVATVSFRAAPSTSGALLRYFKAGERIDVTSKVNASWYAVKDASGQAGYVSTQDRYVELTGAIPAPPAKPPTAPVTPTVPPAPTVPVILPIEKVITAGQKYLGTPYEYASSRETTTTFDCSDFVRQAFRDALDLLLPADSRKQGAYVKEKGGTSTSWQALKRGDLMFFMDYKGTSASLYTSKSPYATTISHVGIYLGNGQVLHTYSKESGGVRIDSIAGKHWEYRFLFGGSAL